MEVIFHSHANETHFHKKGCAPRLILKSEGFWNSEVAYWSSILSAVSKFGPYRIWDLGFQGPGSKSRLVVFSLAPRGFCY